MNNSSRSISISSVSKHFGGVCALDNVSLEVLDGEFVTLLGPSGSGKTTLLNLLAGFSRIDSGTIRFGNLDVTMLPPHRRNIGMVFQSYALFPHMTVRQNVGFPLIARGYRRADIRSRSERALELVKLGGYGDRRIDQLSGGQRQRVALARAIVFEPGIVLMDEPLSALDKQLREHMQIEIRNLHEFLSATIIYVTHDQKEALTMSDRVAVLNDGRLRQIAGPEELYDNPADRFVASFVGETDLLPVKRTSCRKVQLADTTLTSARDIPSGDELWLVLRPEKLILVPVDTREENVLRGTFVKRIFQGDSVLSQIDIGAGDLVTIRQLSRGDCQLSIGDIGTSVALRLDPQDVLVVTD